MYVDADKYETHTTESKYERTVLPVLCKVHLHDNDGKPDDLEMIIKIDIDCDFHTPSH